MNDPLISVIIPTYNYGRFVVEAVESALAQTYSHREIIVLDDGSRDDTRDRLLPYFDRIVYIYQENQGLSSARNAGICASRGEYIALLDSDDVWYPAKLEIQAKYLAAIPGLGLLAAANRPFSGDYPVSPLPLAGKVKPIGLDDIIKKSRFGPSGVIVRRSCFDEVGLFDESLRSAEDRDMWIRIARRRDVALLTDPLWWYRIHGSSMSQDASRMEENEERVLRKAFAEGGSPWLKRRAFSLAAYSATFMYLEDQQDWIALRRMIRSLIFWPLPYSRGDVRTWLARPRLLVRVIRNLIKSRALPTHRDDKDTVRDRCKALQA